MNGFPWTNNAIQRKKFTTDYLKISNEEMRLTRKVSYIILYKDHKKKYSEKKTFTTVNLKRWQK